MLTVREAMDIAIQNSGAPDIRYVEKDGSFMFDVVAEIESITQDINININNWLPKLATIAARGELESALVIRAIYLIGLERGFNEE